jgi:hypothetical protein
VMAANVAVAGSVCGLAGYAQAKGRHRIEERSHGLGRVASLGMA